MCFRSERLPLSPCAHRDLLLLHYCIGSPLLSVALLVAYEKVFPTPIQRPYEEQLREEYTPLSAQAQMAQQIRHATQQLEREERTAMYAFGNAGNSLSQDEAHRQWQEAGEKLKLLKEEPEQYLQRYGPPTVTVAVGLFPH